MSSILYIRQMKVKFSAWLYLTALILTISNFAVAQTPNEVKIGTQVWMTKNLDVSKFRNGDLITEAKTEDEWKKAGDNKQPAWCYYDNNSANGAKYGKLYNWYAVSDARGLAPEGWHVPEDREWRVLIEFLGGEEVAGKKMKSKDGWKDFGNGTNESGFAGRPGSKRNDYGAFYDLGYGGCWWSSSEADSDFSFMRFLASVDDYAGRTDVLKREGLAVRCIRD
jgi:uncharacterized protein (TIGR02145 family)